MCRIFGFRSIIQSQVHRSLMEADNALCVQSREHPDGWGVAYYVGGAPHLIKSPSSAISDRLFHRVSGIVASETVVAHIRRATQGEHTPINCHPFQYGRWIFAHNGNLAGFAERRDELVACVPPQLRRFILGQTDSEVLFYLLLGHMEGRADLHEADYPLDALADAVRAAVDDVISVVGPYAVDDAAPPTETFLTFVLTNGTTMIGHQGGKRLRYSTYKSLCPERDACPSFSPECEAPTRSGFVNHLVLSSEEIHGVNVWHDLLPGQMVAVDRRMRLRMFDGASLGAAAI